MSEKQLKEVLELSVSKEIKDKLKSTTQKALDYGVSRSFPLTYTAAFTWEEKFSSLTVGENTEHSINSYITIHFIYYSAKQRGNDGIY